MFRLSYNIIKASKKKDIEAVSKFLSKGIDPNLRDKDGNTALHYASLNDSKDIVQLLLDRGADIEAKNKKGETALHKAIYCDFKDIFRDEVKLLLDRGANIEVKNKNNETALHYAAFKNSKNIVQLLLDRGADIEAKNKKGETALHYAEIARNKRIVRLLIQKGALESYKKNQSFNIKNLVLQIYSLKLFRRKDRLVDKELNDIEGNTNITLYERQAIIENQTKNQKNHWSWNLFLILAFSLCLFLLFIILRSMLNLGI